MNNHTDLTAMLALIPHPAFCVQNGIIIHCNSGAERMLIQKDTPVAQLLGNNAPTYDQFENGCLFLSLMHNGHSLSTSVTHLDNADVFVIDADAAQAELKTLSLVATTLRQPVSSVIATAGNLSPIIADAQEPKMQEYATQMNRHLWRIHRMLCNMADAVHYIDGISNHMVCQNVTSLTAEVFQKVQELAEHCGVTLSCSLPNEDIICLIDDQLLERAIYNMVSNALKSSQAGSSIQLSLTCRDRRLYLSVADQGSGISPKILGDVFHRYRRQPGIEDGLSGLGLGMVLIRCAAKVHGGTVLLDQPSGTGTRVTLSFPIKLGRTATLASGATDVDYAGGWEHGLLELSDVLPAHLYASR